VLGLVGKSRTVAPRAKFAVAAVASAELAVISPAPNRSEMALVERELTPEIITSFLLKSPSQIDITEGSDLTRSYR
jgi:hypothetical protein